MNEEEQPDSSGAEGADGNPAEIKTAKISDSAPRPEPTPQPNLESVERERNSFERATLNWTRATFGILTATCLFICLQWYAMSSGSVDTQNLVEATRSLAKAASGQAGSMQEFAERMQKQAEQTTIIAGQAVAQSQAAKMLAGEAKRSADIAQRAMEISERPWVAPIATDISENIEIGKTPSATMTMQNSGKSPAVHLVSTFRMFALCGVFPKQPDYGVTGLMSVLMLMPGIPKKTGQVGLTGPLTDQNIQETKQESCNLYVTSRITYDDIFGRHHWRHTCEVWNKATSKEFDSCSFYNDGDEDYPDGQEPK